MSNIREQYNAFNRLYDDFIVQLMNFFPQVHKIRFYRELFHQFKKSDFRIPGRLFLSSVGPHSVEIFNHNDTYFMNGIEVTKTRDRAILEQTIVKEWTCMTDSQKETIWFYLERMLITIMNIDDDFEENITIEEQACNTLQNAFTEDGVLVFKNT